MAEVPVPDPPPRQVVLLAGPSGSGKSRAARVTGRPRLALDDFYLDADHPGLPRTPSTGSGRRLGIVDWDDPATWDEAAALTAITALCRVGRARVPVYDISASRRTGSAELDVTGAGCFVAEGLFAPELVAACRTAGLLRDALYLERPRALSLVLRFVRDLAEHRKPVGVLVRRGLALWRAEPALRRYALARGCRPVTFRKALAIIARDDTLAP